MKEFEFEIDGYILEGVITHYSPATTGNYSPIASDPSEYYGDDEELEFEITHLSWLDWEGEPRLTSDKKVIDFYVTEGMYKELYQKIIDMIEEEMEDWYD